MTNALLSADPALAFALAAVWAWAGLRANAVALAPDPRAMRRRVHRVFAIAGIGALLVCVRVVVVALLSRDGWWFVQGRVVLSVPIMAAATMAVLALSVPRLIRLTGTARTFNGIAEMPPALRYAAADPLVAVPILVAAYAAVVGVVDFVLVGYPVIAGAWLAVVTGLGAAALVTSRVHLSRRARFAADVVIPGAILAAAHVPGRGTRLVRGSAAVAVVGIIAAGALVLALAVTAPRTGGQTDAGHAGLDLGDGSTVDHAPGTPRRGVGASRRAGNVPAGRQPEPAQRAGRPRFVRRGTPYRVSR